MYIRICNMCIYMIICIYIYICPVVSPFPIGKIDTLYHHMLSIQTNTISTKYPLVIKRGNWKSTRNGGLNRKITYKYKSCIFHQAMFDYRRGYYKNDKCQLVDLRENLQETMDFPIKYGISCNFSLKPINWKSEKSFDSSNPSHSDFAQVALAIPGSKHGGKTSFPKSALEALKNDRVTWTDDSYQRWICWYMLVYVDVCWYMLMYVGVCWCMLVCFGIWYWCNLMKTWCICNIIILDRRSRIWQ